MTAHLLVTGGAGFIGSHFVELVIRERPHYLVTVLDKLSYAGSLENLSGVLNNPRFRFLRGDITDRRLVGKLLRGEDLPPGWPPVNAVAHLAAESHVDRSILDPTPFIRTNVLGTQTLLDAALALWTKGNPARPVFLQVSTDEVYGSLEPEDPPWTEEAPLRPSSPYAASKASADLLCLAYHRTFGLPVIVTRSGNNLGPRQFPEKLIPLLIARALEDLPLPLYGDGQQVRDWIYVEDHCRALMALLEGGRPGEVYHVSARNEKANLEVAREILRLLGKPSSLIRFVEDRPGHDQRYALNPAKLERELGWRPHHSFPEALAETVRWYRENPSWRERIRRRNYQRYYRRQYLSRLKT